MAVSELLRFVELCQRLGGELPGERSRRLLAAQLRHLLLCAQMLPAAAVCRCVHPLNANAKVRRRGVVSRWTWERGCCVRTLEVELSDCLWNFPRNNVKFSLVVVKRTVSDWLFGSWFQLGCASL